MNIFKGKNNNEPFYKSVYEQALTRLEAGEPVENIYDDRGVNISTLIRLLAGERSYGNTLDLGCGLGQVAVSLSAKSEIVVAADISKNALKVVAKVAKRKNKSNIHPVLLDATHLPFRDGVFDLIVCSGVLEWVPTSHDSRCPPERLQLNMLREISRALSRLGLFWLGIENRYGYGYLLGTIDHHSGLRFVTLLPRFIANCYSKLIKKKPYRNYLYNYWELRKMLQKAGLAINRFLTAFPYYSNPKVVADVSNPSELTKAVMLPKLELSYASRVIIKAISIMRLAKLLIPSFIVLCTKSRASQSRSCN